MESRSAKHIATFLIKNILRECSAKRLKSNSPGDSISLIILILGERKLPYSALSVCPNPDLRGIIFSDEELVRFIFLGLNVHVCT